MASPLFPFAALSLASATSRDLSRTTAPFVAELAGRTCVCLCVRNPYNTDGLATSRGEKSAPLASHTYVSVVVGCNKGGKVAVRDGGEGETVRGLEGEQAEVGG